MSGLLPQLLLIGAEGHARAVVDVVEAEGRYQIAGLIDSFQPAGSERLGYRILGAEHDVPALCEQYGIAALFVAIGDNFQRLAMIERLQAAVPALPLATCVHPQAWVSPTATLGAGSVVMPGAILVGGCRVGVGCILNTASSLDHDSVMEEGASLAPGVHTGGGVHLGRRCFVGVGASVVQGIRVGQDSLIGAGSVVLSEIPPGWTAFGTPCRVVAKREIDAPCF